MNNLLPPASSSHPSRNNSLSNQTKKLACLTTTITNLQTQACLLQRVLNKLEIFYQINLSNCLKFLHNQWKLILNEQQLRIFQPNDFLLILICYYSSTNNIKIYQLNLTNNWIFKLNEPILTTCLCQPILFFRYQSHIHYRLGLKKLLLPLEMQIHEEEDISIENYFPNKFKSLKTINQSLIQQYHLVLTIRNEAALNFKSIRMN